MKVSLKTIRKTYEIITRDSQLSILPVLKSQDPMGKFTDAAMDRKIIMGEVLEIKPDDILTISGKFFTLIAGSEFSIFDKGTKVGKILISEVTNEKAEGKIVSASGKISKGMRFGKILPE